MTASNRRVPSNAREIRETYVVVVHEEDGGYWGEVPELPGCASQGETMDELLANIIDAIQGCIEVHLGDEGPHVRRTVLTMNVSVPVPPGAPS